MTVNDQGISRQAIAVTGGIGSGKSTVARWLAQEWSLPVYDADDEVRLLLIPGRHGWSRLRAMLDPAFFASDSRLLKAKLRQAIFADEPLRHAVEQALHPLVLENLKGKTAEFTAPCLVEVPLLFEANWQSYFGVVLVVHADDMTCLGRIMARDGISEAQAMAALRAQLPIHEKIALADFSVDNGGTWTDTLFQLETIKKTALPVLNKKILDTLCY